MASTTTTTVKTNVERLVKIHEDVGKIDAAIKAANVDLSSLDTGIGQITISITEMTAYITEMKKTGKADADKITEIETLMKDMTAAATTTQQSADAVKTKLGQIQTTAETAAKEMKQGGGGGMNKNSAKKQFRNLISYISNMSRKTKKHLKKHRKH